MVGLPPDESYRHTGGHNNNSSININNNLFCLLSNKLASALKRRQAVCVSTKSALVSSADHSPVHSHGKCLAGISFVSSV